MKKYMKAALSFILVLTMTIGLAVVPVTQTAYAAKKTIKAKSVTLNHKVYTIKKGKTVKLKATVSPKNSTQKKIVWTSSKKKTASVKSGKVKGLKKGKVTITATVKGTKKKAKATIYVGTPVKNVVLGASSVALKPGETAAAQAEVSPANATVKTIYYSSSDESVAKVSSDGTITATGVGTAVITAAPKDEAGKKAEMEVVVADSAEPQPTGMKVTMITDSGDITDQSFNQTTYEACKSYCEAAGIPYTYRIPASDENKELIATIEKAIDEGYNVVVLPGYIFAGPIYELAPKYPDVKFVAVDISEDDVSSFGEGQFKADNVSSTLFREEMAGYMAGYAAVKLGYTKLGFLGGFPIPAILRYGYGFVQGADAAAEETGAAGVEVKYAYGEAFWASDNITQAMDEWYKSGTECIFACGGSIFISPASVAATYNGKVIGVDVDQAAFIDGQYGQGITLTSAEKDIGSAVSDVLDKIYNGKWDECKGFNSNGSGKLAESTQWADGFTKADYEKLREEILIGTRIVSDKIDAMPAAPHITVKDEGSL